MNVTRVLFIGIACLLIGISLQDPLVSDPSTDQHQQENIEGAKEASSLESFVKSRMYDQSAHGLHHLKADVSVEKTQNNKEQRHQFRLSWRKGGSFKLRTASGKKPSPQEREFMKDVYGVSNLIVQNFSHEVKNYRQKDLLKDVPGEEIIAERRKGQNTVRGYWTEKGRPIKMDILVPPKDGGLKKE